MNYIRNSVKIVVDAYEGGVTYYVFDKDDPIINTYRNIFPSLFRPREEMPPDLLEHVRYPSLLLNVQAQAYTLYHMQNSQTFYNREDLWSIPLGETQQGQDPEQMRPYHLMMVLPGEQQERVEFVIILPFTPAGPGRHNMIGWMAARSDGDHYGETLVFSFPKNLTVSGPAQIRARVNQDPQLSGQITLWNQQGSRVLRGSLLVIPIADSLLYIEPFYLQAVNSPLPELRQVAIATQEALKTGKTFEEALNALFPGAAPQQLEQARPAVPAAPSQAQVEQAPPPGASSLDALSRRAQQLISDYERLTAAGRHREAGEKLDQLKQTLNEMVQKRGSGQ
jgi:uncharacterized membrane protein (UPF0182 family)